MALAGSKAEQVSPSRAALYERYFQRLLQVKPIENLTWKGWREALENIAAWSLLESGTRGSGLRHQELVNRISLDIEDGGPKENLVKRLNRLYRLNIQNELDLLEKLSSAGILHSERRWRFAHDTFEEFFAAGRLLSLVDQTNRWPELKGWEDKETDLFEVINFVAELGESQTLRTIAGLGLPPLLKEHLSRALDSTE
jgi:hypothetical protein